MKNQKKKDNKIINFPRNLSKLERQVEAILFAAEEPLDVESIQTRLNTKANVLKILEFVRIVAFESRIMRIGFFFFA